MDRGRSTGTLQTGYKAYASPAKNPPSVTFYQSDGYTKHPKAVSDKV